MRALAVFFSLLLVFLIAGCGAIAHVSSSTKCVDGFRNDTQGVLSEKDLSTAWAHAQMVVAKGEWIINAVQHPRCGDPGVTCLYMPPNAAALNMKPECLGVKGTQGSPYQGADGVMDDSHNIAIRLDQGHDRAWALASWEMENCIGDRLGFPMDDR